MNFRPKIDSFPAMKSGVVLFAVLFTTFGCWFSSDADPGVTVITTASAVPTVPTSERLPTATAIAIPSPTSTLNATAEPDESAVPPTQTAIPNATLTATVGQPEQDSIVDAHPLFYKLFNCTINESSSSGGFGTAPAPTPTPSTAADVDVLEKLESAIFRRDAHQLASSMVSVNKALERVWSEDLSTERRASVLSDYSAHLHSICRSLSSLSPTKDNQQEFTQMEETLIGSAKWAGQASIEIEAGVDIRSSVAEATRVVILGQSIAAEAALKELAGDYSPIGVTITSTAPDGVAVSFVTPTGWHFASSTNSGLAYTPFSEEWTLGAHSIDQNWPFDTGISIKSIRNVNQLSVTDAQNLYAPALTDFKEEPTTGLELEGWGSFERLIWSGSEMEGNWKVRSGVVVAGDFIYLIDMRCITIEYSCDVLLKELTETVRIENGN